MTAMQLPPTVRRCPKCAPRTDHPESYDKCPYHGLAVTAHLVLEYRECGVCGYELCEQTHEFCVKCGKVLEGSK